MTAPDTPQPLTRERLEHALHDIRRGLSVVASAWEQNVAINRLHDVAETARAGIADRERLALAKDLLAEVRASHRDPDDTDYNECEKTDEQCWWCEQAEWVIKGEGPRPGLTSSTLPSDHGGNHLRTNS